MTRAVEIEQRAARWLILREEAAWSADDQGTLDEWLAASMAHKAAYWRLECGWREADRIASLGVAMRGPPFVAPSAGRRRWMPAAIAAATLGFMVSGAPIGPRATAPAAVVAQRFSTVVGGRRLVPLIDGSRVELNTATSMRASVSDERRDVWLDRGEAYFEIAHRDGLPFVVHAGSRAVTVLGTKFSVRRDGDNVTVSVVEGRVRVENAVSPDAVPAAIITAGDVAVASGPSTLLAARSEERVASALAWRSGMLAFERTPLSDAAAEFNRYNGIKIVVEGAETGAIRIGGTFQADNVDAFVRLLHDAYDLHVEREANEVRISG